MISSEYCIQSSDFAPLVALEYSYLSSFLYSLEMVEQFQPARPQEPTSGQHVLAVMALIHSLWKRSTCRQHGMVLVILTFIWFSIRFSRHPMYIRSRAVNPTSKNSQDGLSSSIDQNPVLASRHKQVFDQLGFRL